jgi:hypothetical protein
MRQDVANHHRSGCGLLLLDWHGSLYDSVVRWLTWYDLDGALPVLPVDVRRDDPVVSYNLLRHRPGAYASVVTGELIHGWRPRSELPTAVLIEKPRKVHSFPGKTAVSNSFRRELTAREKERTVMNRVSTGERGNQ